MKEIVINLCSCTLEVFIFIIFVQASRAQILKKAADYIEYMRKKHSAHQQDIDDLKKQNSLLESQSKYMLNMKAFKT